MSRSGAFVFDQADDGEIRFVGDFEGLYQADQDPWGQSGDDERLGRYYAESRRRVVDEVALATGGAGVILEVGCGHGHVAARLAANLPDAVVVGLDVSPTAVARAGGLYPGLQFAVADFRDREAVRAALAGRLGSVGCVLLNEVLWYLIDSLDDVIATAHEVLAPGGVLINATAFLKDQRYGRDVLVGQAGLRDVLERRHASRFEVIREVSRDDLSPEHVMGITVARARPVQR